MMTYSYKFYHDLRDMGHEVYIQKRKFRLTGVYAIYVPDLLTFVSYDDSINSVFFSTTVESLYELRRRWYVEAEDWENYDGYLHEDFRGKITEAIKIENKIKSDTCHIIMRRT